LKYWKALLWPYCTLVVLATISAGLFIFFAAPGSTRAVVANTGFLRPTAQQATSAADVFSVFPRWLSTCR